MFSPELEAAYRVDHHQLAMRSRIFFGTLLAFLYLLTPLADRFVFHPPEAFTPPVRLLQFGLVVPLLFATVLASLNAQLHRYSAPLTAAALAAAALCCMYQRVLGYELGYYTARGWLDVVILGAFFFSGIRSTLVLPLCTTLLGLNFAVEFYVGDYRHGGLALINTVYELESMVVLFILGAAGCYIIETNTRLNWLETKEMQLHLEYDHLTGALNRGRFRILYRKLFAMAQRERRDITVAMVDIDFFKAFNDHYGHASGDQCLADIGASLSRTADDNGGHCARLGGEEFVLLCYGLNASNAERLLADVCENIAALGIKHIARPDDDSHVTVSVGGYSLIPDGRVNRFAALRKADKHLYRAKSQGRNQWVTARQTQHG
ncbi:MAG: diguanylate cyclase (GGDEF)-like protein [Bermanella sp.]|jgi:diguanylate cyclase (GGDEF)-like protein